MRKLLVVGSLCAMSLAGCTPEEDSEDLLVKDIRSTLPKSDDVELKEPGGGSSSTTTQNFRPTVGFQGTMGGTQQAQYYVFTRRMFDGVNLGTAWVLGVVTFLVTLPPTSVAGNVATWGPGSDALNPAEYRLVVTKQSAGHYTYVFEGRPKDSNDEKDYRATLTGTANGKDGNFTLDFDAANELDPARIGAETESGVLSVEYELSELPSTITAKVEPTKTDEHFEVTVTRAISGGGSVDITSHSDIDEDGGTKPEDLVMHSRWKPTGSGRADVRVTGGDLPSNITEVTVSECWGTQFTRTYYVDSLGIQAEQGDPGSCAFSEAEFTE